MFAARNMMFVKSGLSFGRASREFNNPSGFYVSAGNASILNPSAAITLACWVKITSSTASEKWLIGRDDASLGRSYALGLTETNGVILQTNGNPRVNTSGNFTLSVGVWYHVCVVTSAAGGCIAYVDGVIRGGGIHANLPASTGPTTIGRRSFSGFTGAFVGQLADARLYNTAISAGSVANLVSGNDVRSDLVGHWLTDTNDIIDHSGNANHGTNFGTTFSTDGPLG